MGTPLSVPILPSDRAVDTVLTPWSVRVRTLALAGAGPDRGGRTNEASAHLGILDEGGGRRW
jgi:hypothetical protein